MKGSNLRTWEDAVEDCHKFKADVGYIVSPVSTKTNLLKIKTQKGLERRPSGSRHV